MCVWMCNFAVWGKDVVQVFISLLIFCLVLSISEKGIMNSLTLITALSIFPFSPVSFYFMYFGALLSVAISLLYFSDGFFIIFVKILAIIFSKWFLCTFSYSSVFLRFPLLVCCILDVSLSLSSVHLSWVPCFFLFFRLDHFFSDWIISIDL